MSEHIDVTGVNGCKATRSVIEGYQPGTHPCIDCGAPLPDYGRPLSVAKQIVALLTEIRDNQRAQTPAPAAQPTEVGPSVVKEIAFELNAAADALEQSAKQLKEDGKGWRAGHAHQAAARARQVADGLTG